MSDTNAIQATQQETKAPATFGDWLKAQTPEIAKVLPKHLSADRLVKVALGAMQKTPALKECDATSVGQCIMTCAELGLEPGSPLGHAYLVPFKGKCTLIIGYRGFVDLMRRSGQLSTVRAVVVHERDEFTYREGLETVLEHKPYLDGDPGAMRFVYCVLRLKDGGVQVEVMSRSQVDAIRARSLSGKSGPWSTDYEEMAKKTCLRRAAKLAPMSPEVAKAVEADDGDFIDGEVIARDSIAVTASRAEEVLRSKLKPVAQDATFVPASPPNVTKALGNVPPHVTEAPPPVALVPPASPPKQHRAPIVDVPAAPVVKNVLVDGKPVPMAEATTPQLEAALERGKKAKQTPGVIAGLAAITAELAQREEAIAREFEQAAGEPGSAG